MPTTNVVAAAALAVGSGLGAQPLYSDATSTHLPDGIAGPCMNAAAGDADGDGDLDLALAMEFEPKVLLLNDGAGASPTARRGCRAPCTTARTSRSPTSIATAISTSCS